MSLADQALLNDAIDMWQRGYRIPLDLYAQLAAAGFDVPYLENKYGTDLIELEQD